LDDDAQAEPRWLEAGATALETADFVGGPDVGPSEAPYLERVSDLLLATRRIGSGIPAHERAAPGGPVRSPHDIALCNLFVRRDAFDAVGGLDESLGYMGEDTDFVHRALALGLQVRLDPAVRVRHRRRGFPGAYLSQRFRYRVKTGRLLVERPGLHARGRVAAFLACGFLATAGTAAFGGRFLLPALAVYAVVAWLLSFSIWRKDPILFPAVPLAFAMHHATYFAGLLVGMARGVRAATMAAR
jgi:GT2 family glycosyltransferase